MKEDKVIVSFEEYKNLLGMMLSDEDNDDLMKGIIHTLDVRDTFTYLVITILTMYLFYEQDEISYRLNDFVDRQKRGNMYRPKYIKSEAWEDLKYLKHQIHGFSDFDTRVVGIYFKKKYSL